MTLAGLWGRWRYLWVFAVLPVALIATFVPILLLGPQGKNGFVLAAGCAAFVAIVVALRVLRAVRASYAGEP